MSEVLFVVGTIPFALLGSMHIALTLRDLPLRDLRRPTYFRPTDETLIPALEATDVTVTATAPGAQTMWRTWLGGNLSHGLGLLVFALFPLTIALHNSALVPAIAVLRPLCIAVALTYVTIALRFWFLPAAIAQKEIQHGNPLSPSLDKRASVESVPGPCHRRRTWQLVGSKAGLLGPGLARVARGRVRLRISHD